MSSSSVINALKDKSKQSLDLSSVQTIPKTSKVSDGRFNRLSVVRDVKSRHDGPDGVRFMIEEEEIVLMGASRTVRRLYACYPTAKAKVDGGGGGGDCQWSAMH